MFLLVTATLKAHGLVIGPFAQSSLLTSPQLQLATIEVEIILGLWLVAGFYARALRVVALGTFACFAVVALSSGAAGERSCACFGNVQVSPWLALSFDAAAVAALAFSRVDANPATLTTLRGRFGLTVVVFLVASVAATLAVAGYIAPGAAPRGILVEPARIDFGELEQGQSAESSIRIINRTDKPLLVGRTSSSCPCLTLELDTDRLEPGEQAAAKLRLDMAREPLFVGGLLMRLTLFDGDGEKALTLHAKVRVQRRS